MERADVKLSIDSDVADAVRGYAKLEQAQENYGNAVKIGNRVLKGYTNTQEGLARIEAQVEQIERKAATATQRRAMASLRAQKSAALLAEMTKKQATETRMAAAWESTLAKAQLEADVRNQARMRKRVEEMTRSTEMQRGAFRRGAASAMQFAGSLAGIGTIAAAATAAIRTLAAAHEHQMDVARRSDQQAKGLKEFVALQKPGEAGQKHVRETLARGAAMGLTPEQTAAIAQPIQSVVDDNGDGSLDEAEKAKFTEDTTAAFRLAQMGISADDAQTVITSGRSRGLGGTAAADKLTAASDLSAAGPADFARAASALGQFQDYDTGLAVATALTKEEKNFEQIPTLVRGAALTLGSANDDSDFSKKFGLKGLSEAEKIQRLREIGAQQGEGATEEERIASFSRGLKNYGLDEEKARALGILVRQGETVTSTRDRLQGLDPGLAERKVAALEADPLVGSSIGADKAAATAALDKLYGVESGSARDKRAAALARGAQLQQYGGGMAVDAETGEEKAWYNPSTWMGRAVAMYNGMPGTGFNGGGVNQDPSLSGSEKLQKTLEELNTSLKENTAATQANSGATKKTTPVGGNPMNAEEKY